MENLGQLEDDFYVTEENVDEVLKKFSVNILDALQVFNDYYESITNLTLNAKTKYVYCLTLEYLSR